MWDLIVSVPDHCLSFYYIMFIKKEKKTVAAKKISKTNKC